MTERECPLPHNTHTPERPCVDAYVCVSHTHTLERLLEFAVTLTATAHDTITRQARTTTPIGGGRPTETPLPYHPGAAAAYADLTHTLTWAAGVAAKHTHRRPPDRVPAVQIGFLRGTITHLAAHPDAPNVHTELTRGGRGWCG